jgi:hypothetical protein
LQVASNTFICAPSATNYARALLAVAVATAQLGALLSEQAPCHAAGVAAEAGIAKEARTETKTGAEGAAAAAETGIGIGAAAETMIETEGAIGGTGTADAAEAEAGSGVGAAAGAWTGGVSGAGAENMSAGAAEMSAAGSVAGEQASLAPAYGTAFCNSRLTAHWYQQASTAAAAMILIMCV